MTDLRKVFGPVEALRAEASESLSPENSTQFNFVLSNGERARVSESDERSVGLRELLEEASAVRAPVLVEVDGPTGEIADVQVPLPADGVSSVRDVSPQESEVELVRSQSRYVLRRSNPDYDNLRAALEAARDNGMKIFVTTSDERGIIHVEESGRPFHLEPESETRALAASPIALAAAEALFGQMATNSCQPRTPGAGCITFMFPDDGCYARAHEMCRLIGPAKTGKVWSYGRLTALTRNSPDCRVSWRYHVAPTVLVEHAGSSKSYVIDPSLFSKPVPVATWTGAQGDPAATVVETSSEPFYRSPEGVVQKDPDYVETNEVLSTFRLKLKERSAKKGVPPYAHCPVAAEMVG